MKKKKLLILFALFIFTKAFSCTYTLNLTDSYGDGWNGASMDLYLNGANTGNNYTIASGSNETFTFNFTPGDDISFNFNSGSWDSECSWSILDESGNVVCSGDGGSYTNPVCPFSTSGCNAIMPPPTEEDCLGAIVLCQDTYYNPSGTYGTGTYSNEINVGSSECLVEEFGGNWFTFNPETSGILNFTITPDNVSTVETDYDWVLFDLTTASCADLTTGDPYNYMISANAAGNDGSSPALNQGPTGISSSNASGTDNCVGPGVGSFNTYNPDITVTQGNTYVLYIAQFGGGQGYSVDFSDSQASLYDNTPPEITSIGTPIGCGTTSITFYFSENILCSTVDDADFYLNGPGGPYTISNVTSSLCISGAEYDNYLTADVSPAITSSGTYTIGLDASTAGSITDVCGNLAPSTTFDFDVENITLTTSSVNIDCAGNNNGSFTVNVTSNTSTNYTYDWSDGTSEGPVTATTSTISNLSVDTYIVTVTDDGGCTATEQVTITDNPNPVPNITGTLSICSGSSTTLDAGSGYSVYNWSTTESTQTIDVTTTNTYSITVTDANGCTGTDQVDVNVASSLTPSIIGILTICSGVSTTLDAGAGYTNYTWSPSGSSQTLNVTTGGTYAVTVTDASGCSGTDQVDVTENINPTPIITGALSFCTGYSTDLDAGASYTNYNWSNSDITQVTTITTGGQYTVTVTDNNGCTGTDQVDVTVASSLSPNITGTLSYCQNSSTIIDAGVGYASYNWSNTDNTQTSTISSAGTYTVTVSDASGCTGTDQVDVVENTNPTPTISGALEYCAGFSTSLDAGSGYVDYTWTPSGNTQINTVSSPGNYSVVVTDANGCTGNTSVNVIENSGLSPSITGDLNICAGTTTTLDAGNGYNNYSWSDNSSTQTINVSSGGLFSVTVSDANGCTGTDATTVEINELVINTTGDQLICNSSSTNITANVFTGGNPPYVYHWSTNETGPTITVSPSSQTTYNVYATDNLACVSQTEYLTIDITSPVEFQLFANKDSVCPGDPVLITVSVANGLPPYTITDEFGSLVTPPSTEFVSNQTTFNYTVTDACGLTASDLVTVSTYTVPSLNFSADILNGCQPLTVNFIETSATNSNYTYTWDFGDNANNLSFSQTTAHIYENDGIYDVGISVLTDKGCKNSLQINNLIEVYKKPVAMFNENSTYVTIIDPTVTFYNLSKWANTYYWSFGDGDSSISVNPYHTYNNIQDYTVQLIAVSQHNCRDTVYGKITVDDVTTIYIPSAFSPDGDGINDLFIAKGHGVDLDYFNMKIYDRWGEIIFETNDFYDGWNGKYPKRDEYVASNTYYWMITYRTFKGVEYTKTGAVTVIR